MTVRVFQGACVSAVLALGMCLVCSSCANTVNTRFPEVGCDRALDSAYNVLAATISQHGGYYWGYGIQLGNRSDTAVMIAENEALSSLAKSVYVSLLEVSTYARSEVSGRDKPLLRDFFKTTTLETADIPVPPHYSKNTVFISCSRNQELCLVITYVEKERYLHFFLQKIRVDKPLDVARELIDVIDNLH